MTTSLRALKSSDVEALVLLEARAQPLPWTRAQLEEELAHDDARVRGAFGGEDLLGYAAWRKNVDELWLLNLAVAPEARRQGIGRALLDDGASLARSLGVQELWLEVRASNEGARRLYEAAGYREVTRRREYYRPATDGAPREDAVVMRRELSSIRP